ncbi:ABC transporter substrate-binding protein [Salinibacterium soli]|uniref:Extracellular solute-binding protein n=1 Tax=Antiquaquibacter soli TaxID=3064523 RepID=A0ABT9BS43_9MICO|nr:extracellular solute-binding protein [Protaetiibacter sp. WY-16]MDO7883252.1 extracellular solute-binding protein [Protaetiibacter sp. WY-16]
MKKRSVIAAVAAMGLVTGLVACAPADEGGPVELVIWDTGLLGKLNEDGSAADNSFLDKAAGMYMDENPDISIKIVQQSGDISSNAAQFEAASIAGNGPDIRVQYTGGPTLSFSDFFLDLSDTFDQETFDDLTGWNTVRADYDPNGALYGLPYGSGTYFVVFVNHKLVEAAGMDPNYVPETWEDMIAMGEEYKEKSGGLNPFWVANLEGYVGAWVIGALGGGELGPDGFTAQYRGDESIDSEGMIKAYQAWADLYASGLTNPDAGEVSNGDSTSGFLQEKGAYYIVGMWEDVNMNDAFGEDVSSFFIPVLDGAEYPSVAAGGPVQALSITNYSEHQEEAKDFLRYLAQPELQDLYVEMTQVEPSNSKSADASVIQNPLLQAQAEQLKEVGDLIYPFDNVMPQSVIDLFYRVNASVFLGTMTPEEAVSQLQAALDAER